MAAVGVGPLPTRLLSCTVVDGELVPAWLGDRDRPWLRDLLDDAAAAAGRRLSWLERRWRRAAPDARAGGRDAVAQHVALRLLGGLAAVPDVAPRRRRLFELAVTVPREQALAGVAEEFGTTAAALRRDLFADLPHARRVPAVALEPLRLLLTANLALAQGLLCHATAATLWLSGGARAVLRTAWLHGTDFEVPVDARSASSQGERDGEIAMRWRCGAPAQARGLAAVVPLLPWTRRHRLAVRCELGPPAEKLCGTLVLATGDPILPGPEPRPYDSALEGAFARDFARALPDWELLREPRPLRLGPELAFPDFALRRRGGGPAWLLEIAGLRDPGALARKVSLLAHTERLLLCLPARLIGGELRRHPRVVPFRRRIDIAAVARALAAQGELDAVKS